MKGRVTQLDGLRGVFAVLIIAHHHNAFPKSIFYDNFFVVNAGLYVDFFFVLSGYVIAKNYIDRINTSEEFFSFLKKRFIRLYPLLFFTEIVFLFFNVIGDRSTLKNVPMGTGYYINTITDTLTFMGSTPIFGSWIGLNYPSWSISSEMISYLIFGLVLLVFRKWKYITFGVISLLSIAFIINYGEYMLAYDYGFIRGILCFSAGIFTFKYLQNFKKSTTWAEFPYLMILLIALYIVHHWDLHLERLIFPVIFAAGIVVFSNSTGVITKFLNSKPIQFLGEISYSIYLNHAIVLILLNVLLFRYLKLPSNEIMILISLLASIAITIIYSKFTYQYVEKGIGNYLRKKW